TGGFYIAFDQMVWREPGSADQGPTPWIAFHWAPPDKNPQTWFVNWGVVYRGMIPGRDGDVAGVYGAYGYLSPDQRAVQRSAGHPRQVYEMILEANYRVPVLPWVYLQPDIQGVINPGGTGKIPHALVLALQFGVRFGEARDSFFTGASRCARYHGRACRVSWLSCWRWRPRSLRPRLRSAGSATHRRRSGSTWCGSGSRT